MAEHVVVDGSNIATEGRSAPSLRQLNDAVDAYRAEQPKALITVVVDATFGHRIDKSEVKAFDAAVNANELVAPPAGAVGRGDAFVLGIADKVKAIVLSNDSYQEFHGQYGWLFDDGRLIGGKPVPHIGWVFVPRVPVRGPLSRRSVSDAKRGKRTSSEDGSVRVGSPEASKPMPKPKAPPPGKAPAAAAPAAPAAAKPSARGAVNELMPFLAFVEHHPVGTVVNAVVDHYSSHGAYVLIGDVIGYLPLRSMSSPPPRSGREFVKLGETITLVVETFIAAKRSIDLATPEMATAKLVDASAKQAASTKKAATKKRATSKAAAQTNAAQTRASAKGVSGPVDGSQLSPSPSSTRRKATAAQARTGADRTANGTAVTADESTSEPKTSRTTSASTRKKAAAKSSPAKAASPKAAPPKAAPKAAAAKAATPRKRSSTRKAAVAAEKG
jgi:hypothetical protein